MFLVPSDWYLFSHRKELLSALVALGHDVHVFTEITVPKDEVPEELRSVTFHPFAGKGANKGLGLFEQMRATRDIIKTLDPDLVHVITIRFLLLAPYLAVGRSMNSVISIAGLGGLEQLSLPKRILVHSFLVLAKFKSGSKNIKYVFQNTVDGEVLLGKQFSRRLNENVFLIRGAGVDIDQFSSEDKPSRNRNRILFAARLLKSKGIIEFIEAIKASEISHRYRPTIAGRLDEASFDGLSENELEDQVGGTGIEVLYDHRDMAALMTETTVFVLPTNYAEGLPKVVLEAMAAGAVVITTDWPDYDKVIDDGVSGLIVPKSKLSYQALSRAITSLLDDHSKRTSMSHAARRKVVDHFSTDYVVSAQLKVYGDWIN
nr:glycosyltransferase [Shimia sp. R9_3]